MDRILLGWATTFVAFLARRGIGKYSFLTHAAIAMAVCVVVTGVFHVAIQESVAGLLVTPVLIVPLYQSYTAWSESAAFRNTEDQPDTIRLDATLSAGLVANDRGRRTGAAILALGWTAQPALLVWAYGPELAYSWMLLAYSLIAAIRLYVCCVPIVPPRKTMVGAPTPAHRGL